MTDRIQFSSAGVLTPQAKRRQEREAELARAFEAGWQDWPASSEQLPAVSMVSQHSS